MSGGLDARSYKGEHYQEVFDLLGGDYFIDKANQNQDNLMKIVGDKMGFNNDGLVRWYGGFGQIEYADDRFSLFQYFRSYLYVQTYRLLQKERLSS